MKFLFLTLLSILTFSLSAQNTVPDINIHTLKGQSVNLQDYANNGKITVISFWATWCSPCKKELDAIADLYPEWQEEYDAELLAITIDTQRALAKVPGIVTSKGWEYEILSDKNQDLQKAMNFQTVPQTFILDKEGNIVFDHAGYTPGDEYEIEDKLKELSEK
jgi:peroxiredoxin